MAHSLRNPALFVIFASAYHGQAQSTTASASAGHATIAPGANSFGYIGCYNETTGIAEAGNVRAVGEKGNVVGD